MIEIDNELHLDHIDRLLIELIQKHPDIRQADVMHACPLSGPGTYQRLVRLSHAGFVKQSHDGQRSVTYRIENIKKESDVDASPKQGVDNVRSITP
jgi:hypothetical protein